MFISSLQVDYINFWYDICIYINEQCAQLNMKVMKKFLAIQILTAIIAAGTALKAQDMPQEYLGLPGDNLNLYAVMKLFQESKTLEEFEKNLNDQNTMINNLDLNGDNMVDYLMVIDNVDGDVHNIVISDAVSPTESQDVAVFVVQRFTDGQVQIQLIGDENLYGKNYIIEPIFDSEIAGQTPNPGYSGNNTVVYGRNITVYRTTPVIIAAWPVIRFIYRPGYVVWRSRWHWAYYPVYWHPWQPYYWHYYYGYHYNWYNVYYGNYRRWYTPRYAHWNDYYYVGIRKSSPVVRVRIQSNAYRNTYSHPETRREGESFYAKSNPDPGRRNAPVNSTNSVARRSSTVSTTGSTVRRSNTAVSTSSTARSGNSNDAQSRQGTVTSANRRSTSTTVTRSATPQRSIQSDNSSRRPSTVITNRSSSNTQKSGQATVSSNRRASTSVSSGNTARTRTTQSVSASRSSRAANTKSVSTGSSRRGSTTKASSSSNKEKSNTKKTTSSTRRK